MAFTALDFTEAWTVDFASSITVTSSKIAMSSWQGDHVSWLHYRPDSAFGGSAGSKVTARFEITVTSSSNSHNTPLCGFTDGIGEEVAWYNGGSNNSRQGIWLVWNRSSGGANNLIIREQDGTTYGQTSGSAGLSLSTKYYVTFEFDPALDTDGRVTVTIRTGSHAGSTVETITRAVTDVHAAWSYFQPFMGRYSTFTGSSSTFDIENVEIEGFSVADTTTLPNASSHQDYSEYTEVDPSSDITVTSSAITGTAQDRADDAYVHKTLTTSVTDDFTAYFRVESTIGNSNYIGFGWGLGDATGSVQDAIDNSDSLIVVGIRAPSTTTQWRLYIQEVDAGSSTAANGSTLMDEGAFPRYITVAYDRNGGAGDGQIVAKVKFGHPENIRDEDTATLNLANQRTYTEGYAFCSLGSGSATADWDIRHSYNSFDGSGTFLHTVETDIELSQTQVFDANETISEDGIKRDLGGKSVARDGTQSRIWVLGVDTSLDDTIALYTPSDGITWVGETITSNFAARGHAMVIGDGGEPVVALHKNGTTDIQVWQRSSGGVWSKKATVSAGSASDIDAFGIHFDGTTYHLVYMDKASTSVAAASRCRLRHRTSTNLTSWSSATTVDAGHKDGPYGNLKSMCAAMDSNNDIHVVYGLANSSGEQKLNYVVYDESAGTWGSVEEIEDFGVNFLNNDRLIYIDLAIDENDKPHFVGVIEADQILGASNGFVDDDDPAVFYWERTGSSWSSALVVDATDDTVQANYNPTIHMNNGTTAIVHWGSQTTSGAELKRAQRSGGGWTRTRVGNVDQFGTLAANFEADAAHYVRTNGGYLVTGDFLVLRGSIIMIQSVATVWGDGTTLMESIPTFSQTLQVQGRAAPSTDFEVSQTVTVNRAYSETREHDATFEAEVSGVNYDRNRSDTRTPVFENGIGYTLVPTGGGGDTHYIQVTENRLNFSQEVRQLVQTEFVDELTFSQEIGLTLGKTVEQDVEFSQDIDAIRIKLLTADGDVLIDDAVLMNKTLNLGVSTDIAFSQQGIPIRDWNAYSTHFDPGWGSEDSTTQVVFLHPSSLPTTSVTMMRPDFGDVREDRRRSGAIRRNRSGQPRSFKTPVYSTFVLTWTGIPRFVAEEFRTRMVSYMGDKLRYQDHNGVFQEVIIADEALIRNQGNHEHCTLSITLAKVERIDVAPTTVG